MLSRTFDDGNVGSVARNMLNFGMWDLRLVNPMADALSDTVRPLFVKRGTQSHRVSHPQCRPFSAPLVLHHSSVVQASTRACQRRLLFSDGHSAKNVG